MFIAVLCNARQQHAKIERTSNDIITGKMQKIRMKEKERETCEGKTSVREK